MATASEQKASKGPFSVSVGCIAFASHKELADDSARFFAELEAALSAVENITELSLQGTDSERIGLHSIKDPFDKEERYFPHPYGGLLYYRIFIPFKIQDEIGFRCDDEYFDVFNYHHYDHLVTYVPGHTAGRSCGGGGTSLALIREYLKTKLVDGPIRVAIVGPSPFHATFWCSEGEACAELVDVTTIAGLHEYRFDYESDGREAIYTFVERYGDTFALYYLLQSIRNSILDCDREINQSVDELLSESRSIKQKLEFRRRARSKIDKIHKKIVEANALRRTASSFLQRADNDRLSYRVIELSSQFFMLKNISQDDSYDSALSIATIHEERNRSFYENSSILIAGLAGGLIGALLTSLLN